MRMKIYIYALIDPETNLIRYIGKTTNLIRRLNSHLTRCKSRKYHSAVWINSLLSKGLKPFLEVLEEVDENTWVEREKYWISFYKHIVDLTNILDGGEGGATFGRLGKPWSDEQRKNNKKARTGKPIKHTIEGKENRTKGVRQYCDKNKRKVYQYDLKGKLIKEWACAVDAGRELKINPSNIHRVCNGKQKQANNSIWDYDITSEFKYKISNSLNNKKRIIQLDLNDNIINVFDSITEASKETNILRTSITNNLKRLSKTAGGYKWNYIK